MAELAVDDDGAHPRGCGLAGKEPPHEVDVRVDGVGAREEIQTGSALGGEVELDRHAPAIGETQEPVRHPALRLPAPFGAGFTHPVAAQLALRGPHGPRMLGEELLGEVDESKGVVDAGQVEGLGGEIDARAPDPPPRGPHHRGRCDQHLVHLQEASLPKPGDLRASSLGGEGEAPGDLVDADHPVAGDEGEELGHGGRVDTWSRGQGSQGLRPAGPGAPGLAEEAHPADLARSTLEAEGPGRLVQSAAVGENVVDDQDAARRGAPGIGDVEDVAELGFGDAAAFLVTAAGEGLRRSRLHDRGGGLQVEDAPPLGIEAPRRLSQDQPDVVEASSPRSHEGGAGGDQVETGEEGRAIGQEAGEQGPEARRQVPDSSVLVGVEGRLQAPPALADRQIPAEPASGARAERIAAAGLLGDENAAADGAAAAGRTRIEAGHITGVNIRDNQRWYRGAGLGVGSGRRGADGLHGSSRRAGHLGVEAVEGPEAAAEGGDDPRLPKPGQVMADGGLPQGEYGREVADAQRGCGLGEEMHDAHASGVGESLEQAGKSARLSLRKGVGEGLAATFGPRREVQRLGGDGWHRGPFYLLTMIDGMVYADGTESTSVDGRRESAMCSCCCSAHATRAAHSAAVTDGRAAVGGAPAGGAAEPRSEAAPREDRAIQEAVRAVYAAAATAVERGGDVASVESALLATQRLSPADCCSSGDGACACGAGAPVSLYSSDEVAGLPSAAVRASLGCGNPTAAGDLRPGEVVLDLGSGGGIDVLLSARRVGPTGFAYGVDMTDEMLALAERNAAEQGAENVRFLKGTIEDLPLPDASVDVVISNCVVNLSADKARVLGEAYRVLRPGGRLAVSDVLVQGHLPAAARRDMELWAGCVAGALEEAEYRSLLTGAGFAEVDISLTPGDGAARGEGWETGRVVSALVRARKSPRARRTA